MKSTSLLSLTYEQFYTQGRQAFIKDTGDAKGSGVAGKLYGQYYRTGRWGISELGLNQKNQEIWNNLCDPVLPLSVMRILQDDPTGEPGTKKAIFRLDDGNLIETVLVPMVSHTGERGTLCLSSQAGCAMGCTFCETGKGGLVRSLTAAEIVAQVHAARFLLKWEFTSVVFMGMGEPLDNLEGVIPALKVLADPRGFALAQEKITLCTVGLGKGISQLANLGWKKLGLSLSLNAGRQMLRESLMPAGKLNTLEVLKPILAAYPQRRNFVLALNYCLMPGINDTEADIQGIVDFSHALGRTLINLIPYNPGSIPLCPAPTAEEVDRFLVLMQGAGLQVKMRGPKGRSIMAGCGQLGGEAPPLP